MREAGEQITYLTAYDYLTAKYVERAGIDMILVGDSVGNVVHGYGSTIPVTMDEMVSACRAVRKGAPETFIIGDMPFMSYQTSDELAVDNAGRLYKEAGVDCVKLEGFTDAAVSRVKAITEAGMLVMGHIGLTPQLGAQLGGNKAQGKSAEAAVRLVRAAEKLEKAGACSLVVECVPSAVCEAIHDHISIPVLGIGSGSHADGQLMIYADMLGLFDDFTPKFVKKYANVGETMLQAFKAFADDVHSRRFPEEGIHTYKMSEEEIQSMNETLRKSE